MGTYPSDSRCGEVGGWLGYRGGVLRAGVDENLGSAIKGGIGGAPMDLGAFCRVNADSSLGNLQFS